MNIIAILNNKGGVGKTTITQNLSIYFGSKGIKIGIIDFDGQANLTYSIPHTPNLDIKTLLDKRTKITINEFCETKYKNLYLIPNNKDTDSNAFNSFTELEKVFCLKDILTEDLDLDILLIDNPPTMDIATTISLIASNYVIVPLNYNAFSTIGLGVIYENIESVKRVNPTLKILGILANRVDERMKITGSIRNDLKSNLGEDVFENHIRTNANFESAQNNEQSIFEYEERLPDKKGSDDISKLGDEIIKKLELNIN